MLPKKPDETSTASDRRQSKRKKIIVNVDFEGGGATGIASTRDIGLGGLYLVTDADCEIGTPLRLKMTFSGGQEVSFDGTVVYADPGQGIGVRFRELSENEQEVLKKELELEEPSSMREDI